MTADAGFLAEIIAHPEDDTPRLIYADWLEEQGQVERGAEFIRVQVALAVEHTQPCHFGGKPWPHSPPAVCALGGCPVCERHIAALRRRERELWTGCCVPLDGIPDEWIPTLSCDAGHIPQTQALQGGVFAIFSRGFVEVVRCSAQDWLQHSAAILERHPVVEACFGRNGPLSWTYNRYSDESVADWLARSKMAAASAIRGAELGLGSDETDVLRPPVIHWEPWDGGQPR